MANILYRKQKQQKSLDNGVTWIDTGEYRVGAVLENPSNCSGTDTKQCRWVDLDASEGYYCDTTTFTKYTVQVEECSENGIIWTRTGNQKKGNSVIQTHSTDCGYVNNTSGEPNHCDDTITITFTLNYGDEVGVRFNDRPEYSTFDDRVTYLKINPSSSTNNGDGTYTYTTSLSDLGITELNSLYYFAPNYPYSLDLISIKLPCTDNVTHMGEVFNDCMNLTSITNLNSLNTSKVTRMYSMFQNCSNLTTLDVSNFDTSNVTNMNNMFNGCENLTALDVRNFNTSKVEYMGAMFASCHNLKEILGIENFDLSGLLLEDDITTYGSIEYMFHGCKSLTELDLSKWDTYYVYDIDNLFYGCESLRKINLTGWDISNIKSSSQVFWGCESLTKLILGSVSQSTYDFWLSKLVNAGLQNQVTIEYTIV